MQNLSGDVDLGQDKPLSAERTRSFLAENSMKLVSPIIPKEIIDKFFRASMLIFGSKIREQKCDLCKTDCCGNCSDIHGCCSKYRKDISE